MQFAQTLEICKRCEKRKFDMNSGIVCSLTLRKPEFNDSCKDFVIDAKEDTKLKAKANNLEKEEKNAVSTWGVIVIILIIVRIFFRLFRD